MKAMRREIEGTDVAAAPVVSEGGGARRRCRQVAGYDAEPSTIGPLAPGQRWSVGRKREVVLRLLRGECGASVAGAWRADLQARTMAGEGGRRLDGALKERESDPASGELAAAMQRIGELSMEVELLRARIGRPGPLAAGGRGDGRGDVPDHRRRYGVARVCQIWDQPRSSFYAARPLQAGAVAPASPSARRGPKPSIGDEALLAAIHADLERSRGPAKDTGRSGPGAAIDGVRVSRKRLLRLMREHGLLSPHRARTRSDAPHDRRIYEARM